jgi:sugar lactone lactonase YvrE
MLSVVACGRSAANTSGNATIDTLPGGTVIVRNPAEDRWSEETAWRVSEDLRLGATDAEGPEQFGRVMAVQVDVWGRIYVLDGHAHEIRVFDSTGAHVRTFGSEGSGPGELRRPMTMLFDPDGNLRVLDPPNNRISVFDTTGAYRDGPWMAGSFFTTRWPGGYDDQGYFYNFLPDFGQAFRFVIVRFDSALTPLDTIRIPEYEGERFEYTSPDGNNRMQTAVPFAPFQVWRLQPGRVMWEGVNDRYRFVSRSLVSNDTLRIIERDYDAVPVTRADRDSALASLDDFVKEGGKIDPSRIPGTKPAYSAFIVDIEGNVWVLPFTETAQQDRLVDVFDPEGRYLGRVSLPFKVESSPWPIITDRHIYAVTEDDLGVQYVVRGRIEKPEGRNPHDE